MNSMDIWVGHEYQAKRILVLGESWYGSFPDQLATDSGYIAAYLAGRVTDRMYSKMANACGPSRNEFWQSIAFTNFVQCIGEEAGSRPTDQAYKDAKPRLADLLKLHQPQVVWVLGEEQAKYSSPVIESMDIPVEVAWHPMRIGCTSSMLNRSWGKLLSKLSSEDSNGASGKNRKVAVTAMGPTEMVVSNDSLRRVSIMNQTAEIIKKIFGLSGELEALYPGRKFTPDGHMVGSIGEVLAAEMYNLELLPAGTETHDAIDVTGRKWQIKLTSGSSVALRSEPEWLLVMKLSKEGLVEEVFNGPGHVAWRAAGKMQKNGQCPISLQKLRSSRHQSAAHR